MNYTQLLEEVKAEVTQLFQNSESKALPYHNISHSKYAVSKAVEIAAHYELNDKDFFIVVAATWFHDTGYLNGPTQDHEFRSIAIGETFLQAKGLDHETIQQFKACIMATRMPQQPDNFLEQIVCDADLYHLGTEKFEELNKKMRKEAALQAEKKIRKEAWNKATLLLLEAHKYHTDYAKELLSDKKQKNIERLKSKIKEIKTDEPILVDKPGNSRDIEPVSKDKTKSKKNQRPDRGIETMFRISSNNHQRLSDMADKKANIMITTTSIILSILLSILLRKLEDNQHLIIPAILLLTVCVVTMVFSILATRPTLPNGYFTKEDLDAKKTNLLFFGNYYRMSFDEYTEGMQAMMKDREFLYGSLIRDVYSQGIVLGRKYRLLRFGYNVFMYGIIVSVLAFVIAAVLTMQ